MPSDNKDLLEKALQAICLTRDYVGEELLPPIPGWEWYDAGMAIAAAIPNSMWAEEFRMRCRWRHADDSKARIYQSLSDALELNNGMTIEVVKPNRRPNP